MLRTRGGDARRVRRRKGIGPIWTGPSAGAGGGTGRTGTARPRRPPTALRPLPPPRPLPLPAARVACTAAISIAGTGYRRSLRRTRSVCSSALSGASSGDELPPSSSSNRMCLRSLGSRDSKAESSLSGSVSEGGGRPRGATNRPWKRSGSSGSSPGRASRTSIPPPARESGASKSSGPSDLPPSSRGEDCSDAAPSTLRTGAGWSLRRPFKPTACL